MPANHRSASCRVPRAPGRVAWMLFLGLGFVLAASPAWAQGRVEMEIASSSKSPLAAQEWFRLLTELKVAGLRIRPAMAADRPKLEASSSGGRSTYKVLALLTEADELLVPGGRFSLRDRGRLAGWVDGVAAGATPGAPATSLPFGLDKDTLLAVDQELRRTMDRGTKGQRPEEAIRALRGKLTLPLMLDSAADQALAACDPVADELQGLSLGTALAAIARPAGLIVTPRKVARGGVELALVKPGEKTEAWPIGFPADDKRREVLPKLFESINVQVEGVPLADALASIAGRLEVPLLVDHNSLALKRIDLHQLKPTLPSTRLSYSLILKRLLSQAQCGFEVRTDDAGKPFLWVTTFQNLPQ